MYISKNNPTIKGFNHRGLYRMKQFYELYIDDELVTPLVAQISWTNHLIIMSGCKTKEEVRNRDGLKFKIEQYELTINSYLLNRNK